jgi:hypothetical protein
MKKLHREKGEKRGEGKGKGGERGMLDAGQSRAGLERACEAARRNQANEALNRGQH